MLVDIHTHRKEKSNHLSILSLDYSEIEQNFKIDNDSYYSVGFHPWHTQKYTPEKFAEMELFAANKSVLAIGECGLDKHSTTDTNQQLALFEKHILLSESLKKPLIIHCVGFFNELISIKNKFSPTQLWIIHGFRGKPQLASQLLKADFYLSFGEHFNLESLNLTPIENLLAETDESKLSIEEIYNRLAHAKQCQIDKLSAGNLLFQKK